MAAIGITLAGVALPDEAAVLSREIEHRDRSRRVLLEQGDGGVAVLERWTGREIVVSCTGFWPPALRALSRTSIVTLIYPDLELPASETQLRSVTGLITDLSWTDALGPDPISSAWSVTLRELSALATLPTLSVGGVAIAAAAQAEGVEIALGQRTAGTLLELSDGTAVPQLAWSRRTWTLSGRGWAAPALTGLVWGASATLITATYGSVACWVTQPVLQTESRGPDGPVWAWSIVLREQ